MATFRVGQRVRIVNADNPHMQWAVGIETTITGLPGTSFLYPNDYQLALKTPDGLRVSAPPKDLAPLTDPDAERFVESLKCLAREPITTKDKVRA